MWTALRPLLIPTLGVAALVLACTSGERREEGGTGSAMGAVVELVPTLAVVVTGDSVRFRLRVANDGAAAVPLEFGSAQRYDFVIFDGAGAEVWRWSSGRMFAQVVGLERLEPGAVLEYEESWDPAGREGEYRAEARLVSSNRPLELSTEFELGDG